jgi:hypothetical protein
MVYICKLYANGTPEQKVAFQTLLEAELWAIKNARVAQAVGTGWDVRYTVSIYGDVKEDADLLNMVPIKIILE